MTNKLLTHLMLTIVTYVFLSGFDSSNHQYILECSVKLHFDINDKNHCYKYTVFDDDACEVQSSEIFKLRLALIATNDSHLQIHDDFSVASAWVDDTNEPECCKSITWWICEMCL